MSVAGIIGFWCKDVPNQIFNFFKKQFTTKLAITNHHIHYYNVIRYLENNYKNKKFRSFKIVNGKWGEEDKPTIDRKSVV